MSAEDFEAAQCQAQTLSAELDQVLTQLGLREAFRFCRADVTANGEGQITWGRSSLAQGRLLRDRLWQLLAAEDRKETQ